MVGVIWLGALIMAAASIILAAMVLLVYSRIIKYGASKITVGHLFFASGILVQNLVAFASYLNLANKFGADVGLPAMLISLTGVIAVGFLVWAIWQ